MSCDAGSWAVKLNTGRSCHVRVICADNYIIYMWRKQRTNNRQIMIKRFEKMIARFLFGLDKENTSRCLVKVVTTCDRECA